MSALEWTGAVFVVLGYWAFGRNRFGGAVLSIIAGLFLTAWALLGEHWGMLALNVVVAAINARTAWRMLV